MSDERDIVERLRDTLNTEAEDRDAIADAADEIERLRGILKQIEDSRREWWESVERARNAPPLTMEELRKELAPYLSDDTDYWAKMMERYPTDPEPPPGHP